MKNNSARIIMILTTVLMCLTDGNAQEKKGQQLLVGKPMPEFVILPDSKQKKAITNKTLLGKPAIIMLFSTGCVGSFRTLPKVDALYKQFKNDVNFVIVGKDEDSIRYVYPQFKLLYKLELPVVFDKGIFNSLGLSQVPTLVWLTREGVVQAVTHEIHQHEVGSYGMEKILLLKTLVRKVNEKLQRFSTEINRCLWKVAVKEWKCCNVRCLRAGTPVFQTTTR